MREQSEPIESVSLQGPHEQNLTEGDTHLVPFGTTDLV